MKKKKPEPVRSLVPMNLKGSPRFRSWLKAERIRRGLVTWQMLEELALCYVGRKKGAASWPLDP